MAKDDYNYLVFKILAYLYAVFNLNDTAEMVYCERKKRSNAFRTKLMKSKTHLISLENMQIKKGKI